MSVIIRLQGLPWSASAMNIRHFFAGLNIPAGGVHIIGGEGGDAFIAFSSDDDARMAMKKNNCPLNGTTVQLFLSSKAEMQSVIDAARAGSSTGTAAVTPANTAPSQQQTPAQQQRQPFSSTSAAFPVDSQTQSSANGAFPGQQMNDFNQQMPPGQFARGDWQGFQSYGSRMDDQSQQMPNQFMYNQRMPGNQADGRFPSGQGGPGGMDRAPYGNLQGGQFHDASSMLPQTGPAAMGMGGMYPDMDSMTQKPSAFGEQVGGRAGNVPPAAFDNTSLLGNMGGIGRGQSSFPGQLGIGLNRNAFNAGMGKPIDMPGGLLGNRMSVGDDPLGRANSMDDKSVGDSMDSAVGQGDKFTNPALAGPDGRKADLMGWGDGQSDSRFPGGHQKFEPDIHGDKSMINRENIPGPDGRPFQQFPFRGDSDRGRMNRGLEGADPLIDPSRLMDRQDREPSFPGRDIRTGSRFSAVADPEGRFPDRPTDRFSSERMQTDDMPSTKYPPDSEPQAGAGDRPHGQFPRGRYDDVRYPGDDRQFPPEERFPSEDRRLNRDQVYPPDNERFPERDRKFPPGRGFPPDERRHMMDERRFPPGPGGRRFPADEGRYPPEDRIAMNPDRMRPDEFPGRRPVDNSFDEGQFRDREEEPRPRDAFGRGRRGMDDRFPHEGRPDHRPGFRDFEEGEEPRRFPPGHRFPPERPFRAEEVQEDLRAPPAATVERRARVSRWDREQQLDDWQEEGDAYPRPAGVRPPIADKTDFPGVGQSEDAGLDEPMDMDQRGGRDHIPGRGPLEGRRPPLLEGRGGARPHLDVDGRRGPGMEGYRPPLIEGRGHPGEGMRGRGIEGMRGRGMDGMRGRGFEGRGGPGIEGRRGPAIPSLMEENSFDYGHGSVTRGRPPPVDTEEDEDFSESLDYDSRFPGPAGRGGLFERPPRGRGEPFFNRGRPGPPFGRGRGLDMDRRFEDSVPEGRMSMDVDARNVGGRPDGPPLRPVFGGDKIPDFTVKPGSGKGLLGDAPVLDRPALAKPEIEKKDVTTDAFKRDLDNRAARRNDDRDRDDNRSSDRRGREREDRRSPERDRSRYKYERDRSERRRSRSRERGGRDNDGRRSRERSTSTKQDSEISKPDTQAKNEPKKRCIHMRNLPPTAAYKDIRKFLQPIDISFDSLKMVNDKQGKPTGEAYVQFRHHEDASRAFRRHGERLYGKVISISLCTDEEFAASAEPAPANKKDTPAAASADNQKSDKAEKIRYITQLKDLPLNITKQDIVQFFRGSSIDNNGEAVYIEYDQTGVATGNGFVEFKGDFDYKKALTKDGSLLGTVAVRVFPGKPEEADDLKRKQLEMLQRAALRNATTPRMMQPGLQGQPPRLQGQPPRLQGQPQRMQGQPQPRPQGQAPGPQGQPRPQGQPPRPQGQPPGPQGQQPRPQGQPPGPQGQQPRPQGQPPGPPGQQLRPQGQQLRPQGQQPRPQGQPRPPLMGPRPGMGPQQPSPATPAGQGSQNRASTPSDSTDTVCVHIQGLPLLATPQDIREFFSDCQIAMRGINIAHDSRGKPLGEGFVEFKFKSDFEKAIKKDKTSLGRHIVAVKPIGKKEMMERLENARGVAAAQQSNQGQAADDQHKPQNQNQSSAQSGEKQQAPQNPQQGPPAGQNPQGAKPTTPASTPNPSAPTPGATTVGPGGSKSIPPGVLNKNWYYVRCQNFPPDISISEILTFFQGFRPIGESIRLHYSSDGKPTGNAVVGFGSSEEAQKALRQLTMKVCRQNIVTLHPA